MKKVFFPILGLLLIVGCEKEPNTPLTAESDTALDFRSPEDKIDVCHYSEEDGSWQVINISPIALAAHQAHGDAVDMDGDGYFTNDKCGEEDCDDATYDLDNSCCSEIPGLLLVTLPDGSCLYVTPADQRTGDPDANGVRWSSYLEDISAITNFSTSLGALSDFAGEANTAAIVEQLGDGDYAAKVCDELIAYGYDDWYLPALGELNEISEQLGGTGSNNFNGFRYWSSSEFNASLAWNDNFNFGFQLNSFKFNDLNSCRCVRR